MSLGWVRRRVSPQLGCASRSSSTALPPPSGFDLGLFLATATFRPRGFYPFRTLFCEKTWKMGSLGGKKGCFQKINTPWCRNFCEEIQRKRAKFYTSRSIFGSYFVRKSGFVRRKVGCVCGKTSPAPRKNLARVICRWACHKLATRRVSKMPVQSPRKPHWPTVKPLRGVDYPMPSCGRRGRLSWHTSRPLE